KCWLGAKRSLRFVKRILVIILLLALVGAGYYYWQFLRPGAQPAVVLASTTTPAPPSAGRLDGDVFAVGTVVPARYDSLSMGTACKISEILVKEGDRVEANQPLVRLESDQQATAVAQAEAHLRAAQANLAKLKAGPLAGELTSAEAEVQIAQANLDKVNSDA